MLELALITLGWCFGGFVNGVAGFGAAMIAMPLIAPFIDISVAVPSCLLIVLTLNCHVGWTFRKYIEWHYVKGIFIGAIPGVILSVFALEYLSEQMLKIAMGVFIILYALWSLFADKGGPRSISPLWGYLSGLMSATLGMAFGFNGPPLAAYIAYSGCPARAVKGLLGAGFIITGVFIVAAKGLTGQIDSKVMLIYLVATPAVLLGSMLGIRVSSALNEYSYRKILFVSLVAMGVNIVWKAV
ncbi:MAG: hypothetical protein COA36_12715 [Desulfotalea sp.]|nr:MAG: hypothetical protein COA36_12715 [Desulfotalea sp.]